MLTENNIRIAIWQKKKVLREAYRDLYKIIELNMSSVQGVNLEIGSGFGAIKEFIPNVVTSDVLASDNLDIVVDAEKLPYKDSELANILMLDVFHHIENPIKLLTELHRVLKPQGRIVMVEPYPSFISLPIYKLLHDEPFNFKVDVFGENHYVGDKNPWESNQAIPYLMFYKYQTKFNDMFKGRLSIVRKAIFSTLLYPLSGGYSGGQLIPTILIPVVRNLEKLLKPLNNLLGFRCLVVLEKTDSSI